MAHEQVPHPRVSLDFGVQDTVVIFEPGRKARDIEALLDQAHLVGAKSIVATGHMHKKLSQELSVVLRAPLTPTGLTAESFTAILISDILAQGITSLSPDGALRSSHTLNDIRARGWDTRRTSLAALVMLHDEGVAVSKPSATPLSDYRQLWIAGSQVLPLASPRSTGSRKDRIRIIAASTVRYWAQAGTAFASFA